MKLGYLKYNYCVDNRWCEMRKGDGFVFFFNTKYIYVNETRRNLEIKMEYMFHNWNDDFKI
jgi:hypothetical protein